MLELKCKLPYQGLDLGALAGLGITPEQLVYLQVAPSFVSYSNHLDMTQIIIFLTRPRLQLLQNPLLQI